MADSAGPGGGPALTYDGEQKMPSRSIKRPMVMSGDNNVSTAAAKTVTSAPDSVKRLARMAHKKGLVKSAPRQTAIAKSKATHARRMVKGVYRHAISEKKVPKSVAKMNLLLPIKRR